MSSRNPISVDTSSDEEVGWDWNPSPTAVAAVQTSTKKRKAVSTAKPAATVSEYESSTGKSKKHSAGFKLNDSFLEDEDDSIRESLVQEAASTVAKLPVPAHVNEAIGGKKKRTTDKPTSHGKKKSAKAEAKEPSLVVKSLIYPKTCPDFEMMIGHIPMWKVLHGTGKKNFNISSKCDNLPKDGEKVAKRSNSDKNLDHVPAPPAWAVELNSRLQVGSNKKNPSYEWQLSSDQIRAYVFDQETYYCTTCGEDRLPSQMYVKHTQIRPPPICLCGICTTLDHYEITLQEYVFIAKNQVNDQGDLTCVLCGDPFDTTPNESFGVWSIFNGQKHHDHRAEKNRKYGSTLKEQKGNGMVGLAHPVCNSPKVLERVLEYDAGNIATHFRKLSVGWEKQEELWATDSLPIFKMREEKKKAKATKATHDFFGKTPK